MNNLLIVLYLLYVCAILLLTYIVKKRVNESHKGIVEWFTILSIIVPIIGLLASVGLYRFAIRKNSVNLSDYEDYLHFTVTPYYEWRNQARESLNVMPIEVSIKSDNYEINRELMIKHLNVLEGNHGMYLKKAISGEDAEISHYAATTYNLLKDRYEKRIKTITHSEYEHDKLYLIELSSAYEEYWKSDLLTSKEKREMMQKHKEILERLVKEYPLEEAAYEDLGELLIKWNKKGKEVTDHYQKCIERFPDSVSFYETLIEVFVSTGNLDQAYSVLNRLLNRHSIEETSASFQEVIRNIWKQEATS
ncbi:hypothetical protein HF072_09415 [Bacillus sp. RO3]|nr:hypothetical protein [Bacillus sp. RO3]